MRLREISEETVSLHKKSSEAKDIAKTDPRKLRDLARLELRRRQLRRELVNVECQYRQLELEIELKGIEMPWMTKRQ